jgi:multidrug efflux pump subunit AcrA (membrane-fusion protein)
VNRSAKPALRILLLLVAVAAAPATPAAEIRLDDREQARLGVRAMPARAAATLGLDDQPGTVRVPNDGIRVVTAPAEGVLVRMPVAEGQTLVAGDAVAELAGPAVADLESAYRDAWLGARAAEAELARVEGLVEDGVLARRALEATRVDASRAVGDLAAARAALEETGTSPERLEALRAGAAPAARLVLRARESGTVLRQFARPGERLAQAAPLLELGRLDPLWVEAHVPLDRVRGFAPGDRAFVDAAAGVRLEGRILDIGRRVHEADRGLLVRIVLDDPEGRLIPGQPVEVSLERSAPASAVSVPRSALVMLGQYANVFVRDAGAWHPVPVTVLAETGGRLVLTGAVVAGTAVAVEGTSALKALHDAAGGEG